MDFDICLVNTNIVGSKIVSAYSNQGLLFTKYGLDTMGLEASMVPKYAIKLEKDNLFWI